MLTGKWRIFVQAFVAGALACCATGCDRSTEPAGRGDAELKAEDDAARQAGREQAAHILVKVDDETVDQRIGRLEEDVETLKADLKKEQTDVELLKARGSARQPLSTSGAIAGGEVARRLPQSVRPD